MTTTSAQTVDDVEFGRRLRQHRRQFGLSQAELGGGRFSGSYVSHVESGRRRATPEMIEFFAGQLGLPPEDLSLAESDQPANPAGLTVTSLALQAGTAAREHDFHRAARIAGQAAEGAKAAGLADKWWVLTQQQAAALFEEGEYGQALALCQELSEHPIGREVLALGLEARVLAARSARAAGQLAEAEHWARRVVQDATRDEDVAYLGQGLMALIGTLMARGSVNEAVDLVDQLDALEMRLESAHQRGISHWVSGNVEILVGNHRVGIDHHEKASRLLRPEVDLRGWARFHKASAQAQIEVGLIEGATKQLDKARQAIMLVGNASDRTELRLIEARIALHQGRIEYARQLVDFCLGDEQLSTAPHSVAEAELLSADVAQAQHDVAAAQAALHRAALLFEQAGALQRSVDAWRRHADLTAGAPQDVELSKNLTDGP